MAEIVSGIAPQARAKAQKDLLWKRRQANAKKRLISQQEKEDPEDLLGQLVWIEQRHGIAWLFAKKKKTQPCQG